MIQRSRKVFLLLIFSYFLSSLVLGYIMESLIVGFALIAVFLCTPLIIAYIVSSSSDIKTPYVIGDSNEVVYLTQDELEEWLKKRH